MVAAFAPPALVGVLFVLSLLTLAGRWLPPKAVAPAVIGLCLLMVLLALAMIAAGGRAQLLGGGLTVDPLSAFFLLLPALAGLAVGCARLGQPAPVALPGFLTVTFLVIMAADARIVFARDGVIRAGLRGLDDAAGPDRGRVPAGSGICRACDGPWQRDGLSP